MASTGEVVRGLFTQQLLAKGVAFVTALALWWYVGSELSATHTFALDVAVLVDEAQRKEWRLVSEGSHRVRVDVEGPRQLVEQLGEEVTPFTGKVRIGEAELMAFMDEEVTVPITLREAHFILPNRRLSVVRIEPAAITVRLGRMRGDTVTVDEADLRARAEAQRDLGDHVVTGVSVYPSKVKVVGPVSALARRAGKLPLALPDLTGAKETFWVQAEIAKVAKDEHIEFAPGAKPPTITVTIASKPDRKKYTVKLTWIRVAPPEGFEFEELRPSIDVELEGPREPMGRLTAEHLRAYAYMPESFSTDPTRASGNTARLEFSVQPNGEFPGVSFVAPPRDVAFNVIPAAKPAPPPGSGAGGTPPGNGGQGSASGAKPGAARGPGADGDRKPGG